MNIIEEGAIKTESDWFTSLILGEISIYTEKNWGNLRTIIQDDGPTRQQFRGSNVVNDQF